MSSTFEQPPDSVWVDDRRKHMEGIQQQIAEDFSAGISAFRRMQLAKIVGVDKEDNGRWTGRVTVEFLQNQGSRGLVTVGMPVASNAAFIGGVPEINTVVVLGWVQAGLPIVICHVPFPPIVLEKNKAFPRLIEGEILIRGSVRDGDASHQEPGGAITSDRYGRITVASRKATAEIDVGPDPSDTSILLRAVVRDSSGNAKCQLTMSESGEISLTADSINIAADVTIGGGITTESLATRTWVETVFKTHSHPGVGSPPSPIPDTGFTTKLRSE